MAPNWERGVNGAERAVEGGDGTEGTVITLLLSVAIALFLAMRSRWFWVSDCDEAGFITANGSLRLNGHEDGREDGGLLPLPDGEAIVGCRFNL